MKKGQINENLMIDWFIGRKSAFFQPSDMLVLVFIAAHLTELIKEVARKSGAFLAIIPSKLTEKLQPLNFSPNHSFKSHMQQQ